MLDAKKKKDHIKNEPKNNVLKVISEEAEKKNVQKEEKKEDEKLKMGLFLVKKELRKPREGEGLWKIELFLVKEELKKIKTKCVDLLKQKENQVMINNNLSRQAFGLQLGRFFGAINSLFKNRNRQSLVY